MNGCPAQLTISTEIRLDYKCCISYYNIVIHLPSSVTFINSQALDHACGFHHYPIPRTANNGIIYIYPSIYLYIHISLSRIMHSPLFYLITLLLFIHQILNTAVKFYISRLLLFAFLAITILRLIILVESDYRAISIPILVSSTQFSKYLLDPLPEIHILCISE